MRNIITYSLFESAPTECMDELNVSQLQQILVFISQRIDIKDGQKMKRFEESTGLNAGSLLGLKLHDQSELTLYVRNLIKSKNKASLVK